MTNPFDITGRSIVVVGGTSGLGKAMALGFAEVGANTVATGRRVPEVQLATAEIRTFGVKSISCPCDATSRESLNHLVDTVVGELGGVDVLVYAAGKTLKKPTGELSQTEWSDVLSVNVNSALQTCQAFFPVLKDSRYPRIITIGSLSTSRAFHEVAAYSASKAALVSLTQTLGCEWAQFGIRTNAIIPGVFVTDLNRAILEGTPRGAELLMRTPLKRFGDISEVTATAIFLASDAVSFITGTTIAVDGGFIASGVNQ